MIPHFRSFRNQTVSIAMLLPAGLLFTACPVKATSTKGKTLPESVVFVGKEKHAQLFQRGQRENWRALPIGERVNRAGLALVGTPYENFTLELDNRIETPSANFKGMDCWTFFEIALAAAREQTLGDRPDPKLFLRLIELDRYRNGRCDGTFTSRLHHLEDWIVDNERRGLVRNITPQLPGARKIYRTMNYMGGRGSRNFRQLAANPSLVPKMAAVESRLSRRGIWFVPTASVPAAEKLLRNGDIVCIVTSYSGAYTSHVGLAHRDRQGTLRFLHASKKHKRVLIDSRLTDYLRSFKNHAGIMVARPNDLPAGALGR
ncbi:MAG: N-acetylmuramoyl-L-alanine amidase-like domain-containing protein [Verrucomicrobiia bacterium]